MILNTNNRLTLSRLNLTCSPSQLLKRALPLVQSDKSSSPKSPTSKEKLNPSPAQSLLNTIFSSKSSPLSLPRKYSNGLTLLRTSPDCGLNITWLLLPSTRKLQKCGNVVPTTEMNFKVLLMQSTHKNKHFFLLGRNLVNFTLDLMVCLMLLMPVKLKLNKVEKFKRV